MRLSDATASRLSADVVRPGYERAKQAVGIVHFGIGAFHRAHQAWYTDLAMGQGDRDWMITGVSLRSADVATQMNPQDGLYTLSERSAAGMRTQLVGSVRRVLVASEQPEAVIAELAAPSTRIASFTVTEKGYCRAADGSLDFSLAHSQSLYYFVTQGLRRRRDAGLPGLTLLSCDNLADNGRQLEVLMQAYIARHEPDLLDWFADNCACPATMIDRIVPATTDADRKAVAGISGLDDAAAVVTEPFSQWVIEDRFAGPRPRWDAPFGGGGAVDACAALAEEGGGDPLRCYVFACSNRVLADDIVWVGQYADGLEPWFDAFPREQLRVVRTEDLETATADTVDRAVAWLGLPPAEFGQGAFSKRCPIRQGIKLSAVAKHHGAAADNTDGCAGSSKAKGRGADGVARYAGIPEDARRRLAAHYAPFNRRLEELVNDGRPFWPPVEK